MTSLRVDLASPVPPYEQLRARIADLIALGTLRPHDRLPSVRQLAADLGLAGGTVARAYRELEQAGLVEGRGRHGTVVRQHPGEPPDDKGELAAVANRMARVARRLGVSDDVALAALRAALANPQPSG
ncbi:MAG TPA: GntR family transcriptional regulator [Pseudonocardiaceae bacterium]|jgi:DNA-binding transcriptional regulator YhcF (GntR family)|nr:GntR family transcriptional regulator [Pseudonocardiaceae bacterium]